MFDDLNIGDYYWLDVGQIGPKRLKIINIQGEKVVAKYDTGVVIEIDEDFMKTCGAKKEVSNGTNEFEQV